MPLGRIAVFVLLLGAVVAGGALECNRRRYTETERHGEALYTQMCSVCHGENAEGYRADGAPAIGHPVFLATASDRFLTDAIRWGRRGTNMSAWSVQRGGPLSNDDVQAIIAFLRTKQAEEKPVLDERPQHGDKERGEKIYETECKRCHGARGRGGPYVGIGNPELLTRASNGFLRLAIEHGREGTPMEGFEDRLGEQGVEDVLTLLRSWELPDLPPITRRARPPPIPLGPVPLNPKGPEPQAFIEYPGRTPVDVVKNALDHGAKLSLLDAREPTAYMHQHIAGAVSVPFYDPSPYLDDLPKDSWLVAYCACPHAESITLAGKLSKAGFSKVTILDEGMNVWRARGYPTAEGEKPGDPAAAPQEASAAGRH